MIVVPGEVVSGEGPIPFNDQPVGWPPESWTSLEWPDRPWRQNIRVRNNGDRAIQVGSHFHFYEANRGFDEDPDDPRLAGKVGYRSGGLVVVDENDVEVPDNEKKRLTLG